MNKPSPASRLLYFGGRLGKIFRVEIAPDSKKTGLVWFYAEGDYSGGESMPRKDLALGLRLYRKDYAGTGRKFHAK